MVKKCLNCLGISIEKLENQLLQLKATFSEKEAMLENLKARLEEFQLSKIVCTIPRCGPNSEYPVLGSDTSTPGFELQLIWLQLFPLGLKEEASALIAHWITSGSEERAPESMESTDQSTEVEKEPEKVEEQETTTEWTFLQLVKKICWDITTAKLTYLQKIFGISQPCLSWLYIWFSWMSNIKHLKQTIVL